MAFFGTQDRRQPTAIVFTDVVDDSALVHRDQALGERQLEKSRTIVRRLLPRHGGREIETAGDGFLLEFPGALGAVTAVVAIQQAIGRANADSGDPPVRLRASVHVGDVEHRGPEVFGDGVDIAARLLTHAPPGGVALSDAVRSLVRRRLDLPLRSIGLPALKNITRPVEVFVVDSGTLQAFVVPESTAPTPTGRLDHRVAVLLALVLLALAAALVI